mmetsp:Transcript_46717/g.116892  ORF Transcript_46717/g.116892 Transcript_46717/m.116892 type:complete len:244 (-) Transcript_46717:2686-3417(-)
MALRQEAEHGVHVACSAALGARRVAGLLRVAVHDAPACAQLHDQVDAAIILIHLLQVHRVQAGPQLRHGFHLRAQPKEVLIGGLPVVGPLGDAFYRAAPARRIVDGATHGAKAPLPNHLKHVIILAQVPPVAVNGRQLAFAQQLSAPRDTFQGGARRSTRRAAAAGRRGGRCRRIGLRLWVVGGRGGGGGGRGGGLRRLARARSGLRPSPRRVAARLRLLLPARVAPSRGTARQRAHGESVEH